MTAASAALGRSGEERVADWYLGHGYEVVARNWRCPGGELDIVVARGRMVVFCEVKTRTSDRFGTPLESVTRAKQARIRRLAARWLAQASLPRRTVRFDVASVMGGAIEVIEGAF